MSFKVLSSSSVRMRIGIGGAEEGVGGTFVTWELTLKLGFEA